MRSKNDISKKIKNLIDCSPRYCIREQTMTMLCRTHSFLFFPSIKKGKQTMLSIVEEKLLYICTLMLDESRLSNKENHHENQLQCSQDYIFICYFFYKSRNNILLNEIKRDNRNAFFTILYGRFGYLFITRTIKSKQNRYFKFKPHLNVLNF